MKHISLIFALLLIFTVCGCKSFRKTFSRTPESMKRSAAPKKKAPPPPRKHGETGNGLFDTVFHRGKPEKPRPIISSELNARERELVERSFGNTRYSTDDPDIRRINERNRKSRTRQRDDVFGTKNGRYF